MDATLHAEPQHEHKHEGGGRSRRHLPVLLIVALLVLSSCATFAVIMTNGPDYRAAAEPAPIPTLGGMASATISGLGGGEDKSLEPMEFSAAVPSGPFLLGERVTFGRGAGVPAFEGAMPQVPSLLSTGGMPMLVVQRNGSLDRAGTLYLTSGRGAAGVGDVDTRAVRLDRATGRPTVFLYAQSGWRRP